MIGLWSSNPQTNPTIRSESALRTVSGKEGDHTWSKALVSADAHAAAVRYGFAIGLWLRYSRADQVDLALRGPSTEQLLVDRICR